MAKKSSKSMGLGRKQAMSGWQLLTFALVVGAIGGVVSWAAFAAPHKDSGVTISLQLPPAIDNNSDGLPNFGDAVNFTVSTNADQTYVDLQCSQNGQVVADGWRGFFPNALDYGRPFGLSSGPWQSGAADCTAYVKHYTGHGKNPYITLGSTTFHVNT
jgi:hypothetical protein